MSMLRLLKHQIIKTLKTFVFKVFGRRGRDSPQTYRLHTALHASFAARLLPCGGKNVSPTRFASPFESLQNKKKQPPKWWLFFLAEKERFELSNGFTRYTISSRAPSTKLGDFSTRDKLWLVNEKYSITKKCVRQVENYNFL